MSDTDFETQKGSGLKYVGIGCLAVIGIGIIALVIGIVVAANNWRGWVATPVRQAINEALGEADFSDEQIVAITAETDAFIDAFENGDITWKELGLVAEALAESPVIPMVAVFGIEKAYFDDSELTDEEKADATYQLRRVARGIYDESIPPNDLDNILDPMEPESPDQLGTSIDAAPINIQLSKPEFVTADELREVIANAKAAADEAGVPDEAIEIDYAAEIRKAIEGALGRELPRKDS